MLDLSLFHIIPKAVHLEDFVSLQNQVNVVLILAIHTGGCRRTSEASRDLHAAAGFVEYVHFVNVYVLCLVLANFRTRRNIVRATFEELS